MSDTIPQPSTTSGESGEDPAAETGPAHRLRRPASPFQPGLRTTTRIASGLLWALYFVAAFVLAYLVTFLLLVD